MKKYRFSDGTIVKASCKEEAIKQHKVEADNGFYKFKKPLSEMLKENEELEIKFSRNSHGEVCPNCNALTFKGGLRFCGNRSYAYLHNKCHKCGCEWDANFKLTPTVINSIVMPE